MITAYDSTALGDIPTSAQMVLWYLNGSWPASAADLARFPNAEKESISVTPFANAGDWLDVETGDAFPWQAPDWCVMRRNSGHPNPGVYVEYAKWAATKTEFALRGIPEPRWWIALWDGQAILIPGADGKQYANPTLSGGHFDLSVFSYTFGAGGGSITSGGSFVSDLTTQQQLDIYNNAAEAASVLEKLGDTQVGQAAIAGADILRNLGSYAVGKSAIAAGAEVPVAEGHFAQLGADIAKILAALSALPQPVDVSGLLTTIEGELAAMKTELDTIKSGVVPVDLSSLEQVAGNIQTIVTDTRARLMKSGQALGS